MKIFNNNKEVIVRNFWTVFSFVASLIIFSAIYSIFPIACSETMNGVDHDWKREKLARNEAGYYCKYCHDGFCCSSKDLEHCEKRNHYIATKAIEKLGNTYCPSSKDRMHELKWYNKNPNKKDYLE